MPTSPLTQWWLEQRGRAWDTGQAYAAQPEAIDGLVLHCNLDTMHNFPNGYDYTLELTLRCVKGTSLFQLGEVLPGMHCTRVHLLQESDPEHYDIEYTFEWNSRRGPETRMNEDRAGGIHLELIPREQERSVESWTDGSWMEHQLLEPLRNRVSPSIVMTSRQARELSQTAAPNDVTLYGPNVNTLYGYPVIISDRIPEGMTTPIIFTPNGGDIVWDGITVHLQGEDHAAPLLRALDENADDE